MHACVTHSCDVVANVWVAMAYGNRCWLQWCNWLVATVQLSCYRQPVSQSASQQALKLPARTRSQHNHAEHANVLISSRFWTSLNIWLPRCLAALVPNFANLLGQPAGRLAAWWLLWHAEMLKIAKAQLFLRHAAPLMSSYVSWLPLTARRCRRARARRVGIFSCNMPYADIHMYLCAFVCVCAFHSHSTRDCVGCDAPVCRPPRCHCRSPLIAAECAWTRYLVWSFVLTFSLAIGD